MTKEDLFKYSFVISINNDRYNWYKKVFTHYNLPLSEKTGIKIINQSKEQNCGYNHYWCVRFAQERNYPYCLIFEDDAYPRKDINSYLDDFIYKLNNCIYSDSIDLLYLGYYEFLTKKTKVDFLKKPVKLFGNHAYIVYNSFYDKYLEEVTNSKFLQEHIDHIYKYSSKSYMCSDRLFEQFSPDMPNMKSMHHKNIGCFYSEFKRDDVTKKLIFKFDSKNYEKIV